MHVTDADALFVEVFGQILGHAFGQGRNQHPQAALGHDANLVQQIIDLHFHGPNFDGRVDQPGGADHLFHENAARLFDLPFRRGGRYKHRLRAHCVPFFKLQGAVVHARRQAEPMFRKGHFAPEVALIHAADLGHRHMGFICKNNGIVGDKLEQSWRWFPRRAPCQIAGIVFDPSANAGGLQHFQIKRGALFQPLRL